MRTLLALLIAVLPLAAQDFVWQLGPREALEYRREFTLRTRVVETRETPPPPENADLRVFPGVHNGPVLLGGELDQERRAMATPPADPRELGAFLAFDLRRHGARPVRHVLPAVFPFGDLVVVARHGAVETDGSQRIEAEVTREAPPPRGLSKAQHEAWVLSQMRHGLRGRIEIVRRLDPARGMVAAFTARFVATVGYAEGPRSKAEFTIEERWDTPRIWRADEPAFRERVADAIRRGAGWLRTRVADPATGEFAHFVDRDGTVTYNSGRLALVLLTLLKAEVAATDPVLVQGFAELRRRELVDTYSLALALMAMEARYAPADERARILRGELARAQPRTPSLPDRSLMGEWVQRLLTNHDAGLDRSYRMRWTYSGGQRFDNSNTQYGLLGLWSAHLCGVEVPAWAWTGAIGHFLAEQQRVKAAPLTFSLTGHAELAKAAAGARVTAALRRAEPMGWGYEGNGRPAYGSMTAAGVTGLAICIAALTETRRAPGELLVKAQRAMDSGFAWLAGRFTLRWNPDNPYMPREWHEYYLHCVERACELSRVALLDGRDWYFEGAMLLLSEQFPSGEFPGGGVHGTCFAVLFLKKAQLPVLTGPR